MKRRWFQLHLSTAIVLMFVASWLGWMNLGDFYKQEHGYVDEFRHFGWPIRVHGSFGHEGSGVWFGFSDGSTEAERNRLLFSTFGENTDNLASISWRWSDTEHWKWWLLPDSLVALSLLVFVAVTMEFIARRRGHSATEPPCQWIQEVGEAERSEKK